MPDSAKVKVFVSWSGDLAKEVAVGLRDGLLMLFDNIEPWVSDTDIEAGSRSLDEIHSALADSSVGIVIVTRQNQNAAWLNYEAGALAKTVPSMKARVIPLLIDIESPSQLTGPIAQFQARRLNESEFADVARSLGVLAGVEATTVDRRLPSVWATLRSEVESAIERHKAEPSSAPKRTQADLLEEVLAHVRVLRDFRPTESRPDLVETRASLREELADLQIDARVLRARFANEGMGFILEADFNPWTDKPPVELIDFANDAAQRLGVRVMARRAKDQTQEEPPF